MIFNSSVYQFITILFIVLSNFIDANAQSDIRPGTLLLHNGEVKKGWIDYKEGKESFQSCRFKPDPDAEFITYLPADLAGYGYDGDATYVSRWVGEDSMKKLLFLEVLLDSHYTLLKSFEYYFVESGEELFQQITFDPVMTTIDGSETKKASPKNLGVIRYLVRDCADLNTELDKLKFYDKELIKFFKDFNTCLGYESKELKAGKPWFSMSVKAMAGMTSSIFDIKATETGEEILALPYSNSNNITGGIGFEFYSPRNIESVLFETGVFFTQTRYSSTTYEDKIHDEYNFVNFSFSECKVPIGLTFKLKSRGLVPYIKAGVAANFILKSEDEWIRNTVMDNIILTEINDAVDDQNFHLGFWGGFGITKPILKKHEIFLELRFERTHGITNVKYVNPPYYSSFTYFTILTGIKI